MKKGQNKKVSLILGAIAMIVLGGYSINSSIQSGKMVTETLVSSSNPTNSDPTVVPKIVANSTDPNAETESGSGRKIVPKNNEALVHGTPSGNDDKPTDCEKFDTNQGLESEEESEEQEGAVELDDATKIAKLKKALEVTRRALSGDKITMKLKTENKLVAAFQRAFPVLKGENAIEVCSALGTLYNLAGEKYYYLETTKLRMLSYFDRSDAATLMELGSKFPECFYYLRTEIDITNSVVSYALDGNDQSYNYIKDYFIVCKASALPMRFNIIPLVEKWVEEKKKLPEQFESLLAEDDRVSGSRKTVDRFLSNMRKFIMKYSGTQFDLTPEDGSSHSANTVAFFLGQFPEELQQGLLKMQQDRVNANRKKYSEVSKDSFIGYTKSNEYRVLLILLSSYIKTHQVKLGFLNAFTVVSDVVMNKGDASYAELRSLPEAKIIDAEYTKLYPKIIPSLRHETRSVGALGAVKTIQE